MSQQFNATDVICKCETYSYSLIYNDFVFKYIVISLQCYEIICLPFINNNIYTTGYRFEQKLQMKRLKILDMQKI